MEAERLVSVIRQALAQSRGTPDIIAEAWQAQALAQAVGSRLAASGPQDLRGEARALSEIGGRSSGALDHPAARAGVARAARLTGIADPRVALTGLSALLGEVGMALVGVACETDEQSLYWQCMEAIDAADESTDRVRGMLRLLDARERGEPGRGRERDGPHGAPHDAVSPVTGIQ
ncbi:MULTISPECIES: DUF6099 family protein [unclassified Streptomyces]|uniref:DUF6099 family protein n=1 Tax=unclassified Streptomyces TaxID=2593676 RepID=UPI000DAE9ED7|nr:MULTISPECIES: DUF6099 family protein [unclassified Streptomyces]PZT77213.1 hypothetical protein DNK56_28795 [Streptomyces sp. AC1-42W]PZT78835.1 hypothetical protein DNK55_03885 [Streptomyces sp. AC1-42T]